MDQFYEKAGSLFVEAYDAFYSRSGPQIAYDVAFYERGAREVGGVDDVLASKLVTEARSDPPRDADDLSTLSRRAYAFRAASQRARLRLELLAAGRCSQASGGDDALSLRHDARKCVRLSDNSHRYRLYEPPSLLAC